jgi:ribosomal protein S18 acetylase RimI-like enzyme
MKSVCGLVIGSLPSVHAIGLRVMTDFTVRPVREDDAEGIEAVRSAGWRASYVGLIEDEYLSTYFGDVERRRGLIAEAPPEFVQVVAVDRDGQVIGWSGGGPTRDDVPAESKIQSVYSCYVDPAHWGSGVGRAVFSHVVDALASRGPKTTLWVLSGNARARRFYESQGFAWDGSEVPAPFPGEPMEMRYERLNP